MSKLQLLYLGSEKWLPGLNLPDVQLEISSSESDLLSKLKSSIQSIVLLDIEYLEQTDLIEFLKGRVVFVLANPPYVPKLLEQLKSHQILDILAPEHLPFTLEKALVIHQEHLFSQRKMALPVLMNLKNEALSLLYHQLQGPVTALEGYLEILQSDDLPAGNVQQILTQLQQCATRLRHDFYSLHLLSLVSEVPHHLKLRPFRFHQLISEFKRDLEQITTLNAFSWVSQLDAEQDFVLADPHFMLNALVVLFDLARRTAELRGCQLSLQTSVIASARLKARSQIQLEPDQLLNSFLPEEGVASYLLITFQLRGVTPTLNQAFRYALGDLDVERPQEVECVLGAYLAHRILQQHQSWIYLENQLGFGLLFSFTLPLHEPSVD